MENTYVYWSNQTKWHDKKMATIQAKNITEADAKFEQLTGICVIKTSWISVTINAIKHLGVIE